MGDRPSSIDATAYGFLTNLIWVPIESPLKQFTLKYPQLEAYCQRMKAQYYS
jgi:glutathione S-transferase